MTALSAQGWGTCRLGGGEESFFPVLIFKKQKLEKWLIVLNFDDLVLA